MSKKTYYLWVLFASVATLFIVAILAAIIFSDGRGRDTQDVLAVVPEAGDERVGQSERGNLEAHGTSENHATDEMNTNTGEPADGTNTATGEPTSENPTTDEIPMPSARLAFVGDIMCHADQLNAARVSHSQAQAQTEAQAHSQAQDEYNFNYAFRYIAPYIQAADFAIGNLETTLVREGYAGWPLFRSPKAFAEALVNAGFDMVTTGNNHSFDAGAAGVRSTMEILDEVGLMFTGTYLTPEARDEIAVVEVNGFSIAVLSFTMHTNGIDLGEHNYMVKIIYHDLVEQATIDYDMIRASMARARELNTDFIVVLPHIGIEYYGTMNRGAGHRWDNFDTSDTRWVNWMRTLHLFLDEGADMVLNHHPHTLLPAEFVYVNDGERTRRGFMAYSLANFISGQRTAPRETSAIIYVDLARDENGAAYIAAASYAPIWVQPQTFTVLPVTEALLTAEQDDYIQYTSRLQEVHRDVTHMFSGEPLREMLHEYEITRSRTREEFPGLPLWGSLPWK
ncbi:MAG: CapA family protein [Defluviitaleaceae bacterium]|nr:CapA family protein [Defluviitaleaceae bacterium]